LKGPKVRSAAWVFWLGLLLTLVVFPALDLAAARQSRAERARIAKQQFTRAEKLRAAVEGKPRAARSTQEYLQTIATYRRVYDIAPFTTAAAHALQAMAELYQEMGQQFGTKYFQEAIDTYRFLLREYPYGTHRYDALFTIAQIQWVDLKDPKAALGTFEEYLKQYPKSKHVGKARQAIKDIQQQLARAEASKAQPPATTAPRVQVNNIRYWNAADYTRVVIDLEGEVRYQGARIPDPDRIFFDLFNTQLNSPLVGKTFDIQEGLLKKIRVAENQAGVTRVVLEVNQADDYSVFSLPNPFRLVVDVRGRAKPAATSAQKAATPPSKAGDTSRTASLPQPPSPPKPTREGQQTLTRALGLKIGRIVLDPGHGGYDTGTIGPSGFMEKDLALDVARRLGRLLEEKLGAEVIYTREDDTFVPLENRIALANEKQADLFISIHANFSPDRAVRGVETFLLNFTRDPEALALAARENALSQKSVHELQDLLRTIARNERLAESQELARELQTALYKGLRRVSERVQDRGVKQAPFVVLIGASMPSVLTEIAFLSNPNDEKFLKASQGRQQLAEAMFSGISSYLENLNSIGVARVSGTESPSPPPPEK